MLVFIYPAETAGFSQVLQRYIKKSKTQHKQKHKGQQKSQGPNLLLVPTPVLLGAGVSCILGFTGAWYVLLFYGGAGVVLCLLHGLFRPRSIGSKASRVSAEAKAGFTIEVRACGLTRGDFFNAHYGVHRYSPPPLIMEVVAYVHTCYTSVMRTTIPVAGYRGHFM